MSCPIKVFSCLAKAQLTERLTMCRVARWLLSTTRALRSATWTSKRYAPRLSAACCLSVSHCLVWMLQLSNIFTVAGVGEVDSRDKVEL